MNAPEAGPPEGGISIERRRLLWVPFALAGGALLQGTPLVAAGGAFEPLTHEQFAERWIALAKELLPLSKEHDESYAAQLAGMLARVPISALPRLENGNRGKGFVAGPSFFMAPCVMVEFRMDPGATLRTHNHPPQIVLTLCADGEASYRHFELHGDAPPCTKIDGAEFEVRETRAGVLLPGRTTAVTRARDGMHGFVAGDAGARLIDFTVSTTADIETFSYVELSEEPIDPDQRLYAAKWLGKKA